jgi:hypothetical protein
MAWIALECLSCGHRASLAEPRLWPRARSLPGHPHQADGLPAVRQPGRGGLSVRGG